MGLRFVVSRGAASNAYFAEGTAPRGDAHHGQGRIAVRQVQAGGAAAAGVHPVRPAGDAHPVLANLLFPHTGRHRAVLRLPFADRLLGGDARVGRLLEWHHVALVRQADGTVELYRDGALQAADKGASSGGPITTDLHTLGSDRFIVQAKQKRAGYLAGSIDECCVFGRPLGAADLAVLMGRKKE